MSDLFIYSTNNQPNFLNLQNQENYISNSNNNGAGFKGETRNFQKSQNLQPVNLTPSNTNLEANSFGTTSYPTFDQTKKNCFETINMNKTNNDNVTREFKNPS